MSLSRARSQVFTGKLTLITNHELIGVKRPLASNRSRARSQPSTGKLILITNHELIGVRRPLASNRWRARSQVSTGKLTDYESNVLLATLYRRTHLASLLLTYLNLLASSYRVARVGAPTAAEGSAEQAGGDEGAAVADDNNEGASTCPSESSTWAIQHALLPAIRKGGYHPPSEHLNNAAVVQVAGTEMQYRIFERC